MNLKFWKKKSDDLDLNRLYVTMRTNAEQLNIATDTLRDNFILIDEILRDVFDTAGVTFYDEEIILEYFDHGWGTTTIKLSIAKRGDHYRLLFSETYEYLPNEPCFTWIQEISRTTLLNAIERFPTFLALYCESLRFQNKKFKNAAEKSSKILISIQ